MIVNICGIPHKVIECEDKFNADLHFGQIDYRACEIRINKDTILQAFWWYRKHSIPLDKVKQAREEMKECSYSLRCFNEDAFDEDERVVDLDNVLIILDKLIKSEN